jgi:hypothetical protein
LSRATISLTGAALSAFATYYVLGLYLPTFNTPRTSLAGVAHAPSPRPPAPPLARRVAFLIVDGLSYDAARALDELLPLRRRGAMRSLAVEFPSYTSPSIVSLVSGLGPRDSGTRRNGDIANLAGMDTVLLAARDGGVPVRVFADGYGELEHILHPPPGTPLYKGLFAVAADMRRRELAFALPSGRALDVLHWGHVDDTGHLFGAASPEYAAIARDAAAFVARYARSLDLDRDALVVVSDHGHLPGGGHGGDEPAVMHALFLGVGAPFRAGAELAERPMRDVAATLSLLAGVRVPSSSLGLPMLDALALDEREAARRLAAPFDGAVRFSCAAEPVPRCAERDALTARLEGGDAAAATDAASLHAEISAARDRALDAHRATGARRRLAVTAAALALAALLARRRGFRLASLGPAVLFAPVTLAIVYCVYLWGRGYRPTFSRLPPAPFFMLDAAPAGLLAALVVVAIARLAPQEGAGDRAGFYLLAAVLGPLALLAAWVGLDTLTVPPPVTGVLVFLISPLIISAAVAAPFLVRREG